MGQTHIQDMEEEGESEREAAGHSMTADRDTDSPEHQEKEEHTSSKQTGNRKKTTSHYNWHPAIFMFAECGVILRINGHLLG